MSEKEFSQRIQIIRQQVEALQKYIVVEPTQQQQVVEAMEEIAASLENLHLLNEQMETSLEAMQVIEIL